LPYRELIPPEYLIKRILPKMCFTYTDGNPINSKAKDLGSPEEPLPEYPAFPWDDVYMGAAFDKKTIYLLREKENRKKFKKYTRAVTEMNAEHAKILKVRKKILKKLIGNVAVYMTDHPHIDISQFRVSLSEGAVTGGLGTQNFSYRSLLDKYEEIKLSLKQINYVGHIISHMYNKNSTKAFEIIKDYKTMDGITKTDIIPLMNAYCILSK